MTCSRCSASTSEHERAMMSKPPTTSLSAYELFARARQLQKQFTPAALVESRQLLHQAIERDPDYALAHSGLGFSYAFAFIGTSNPDDLTSALAHLNRATTLDPGLGEAHAWLAYALGRSGRLDEAVAASERAVALEPDFLSRTTSTASFCTPAPKSARTDGTDAAGEYASCSPRHVSIQDPNQPTTGWPTVICPTDNTTRRPYRRKRRWRSNRGLVAQESPL